MCVHHNTVTLPLIVTTPLEAYSKHFRMQGKEEIQEMYDDWLANGKHEDTAAGNMKPVPRRFVVEWIIKS